MKQIFTFLTAALFAGSISATAETVTVYVQDYNYNDIGKAYDTDLTRNEDGSYTIGDVLGSGCPVSFKFDVPGADESSNIELEGNNLYYVEGSTYPYLLTADGDYATCYAYSPTDDSKTTILWPYLYTDGYSYVYRYDMSLPENQGYKEFMGCVLVSGTAADEVSSAGYYYLNFYFDEISLPTSGVEAAFVNSENAPVEYFNLQGVRVVNPQNGIFIRRQGDEVEKVLVK